MQSPHIERIDLNLLRPLIALLEERHVSRAADRMALSQPAMSRTLQRLRRHFGDELLVRGPDGYSLTLRAERIRAQLATAVSELDHLFAAETFDPPTAAQRFRLAVSDYTASALGPELIRQIITHSPNSTVTCESLDARVFDRLNAGTIDLVIRGRAAPEGYRSRHLFTDRFVCVVAAGHPLASRASVSLKQYLRWPHVNIELGQPSLDQALEARDIRRRVAVAMPYLAVGAAVLPGTELVLTIPAPVASQFADSGSVRVLSAPRELGEVPFYAVWHPRVDADPAHRWLRQVIRTVVGSAQRSSQGRK